MPPSDVNVDATLLRNAIRLVHCLQKERGSSCAYYADNDAFEQSMLESRAASDTSVTLIRRNDVPVASQLSKIRNMISSHRNPQESDDALALHRIFLCFNTLISYVVHEYILKEISPGTDLEPTKSTIQNRHRRGLSMDINDRISSTSTPTPELEMHTIFAPPSPAWAEKGCLSSYGGTVKKLATLDSMEESDDVDESYPTPTPESGSTEQGYFLSTPHRRVVFHDKEKPTVKKVLDLLHLFVQLKESAGIERAILSSLLAFSGTDDPSLSFLLNDLILQVENQRFLIAQLEDLPEDSHRNLVLELSSLSPQLQDLQMIILSDFESLKHAEYDAENIWEMITLYVDKLHSVELLLVEELECCLPITMSKVLSSGALNSLASLAFHSAPSSPVPQKQAIIPEEKELIGLTLQQIFGATNNEDVASKIGSMTPEEIKQRLLDVLQTDDSSQGSQTDQEVDKTDSAKGHHFSSVVSLKENLSRVLTKGASPANAAAKEWEISIYELKFSKRIGVGAAATTYLADWTGQQVAVKVASTSRFGLEGWRTEVDKLQRLHHPNIIRLLGSVYHETPLTYCLVLEYCNAGDLSTVLKYPTPKNFFFTAALGIANAMVYLHNRQIIHRDLKPANVLCDGNVASGHFTVKVTDFGVATEVVDGSAESEGSMSRREMQNLTGETGTYRWMAPEVIRHEVYTTKADVYSFAVLLWQFLTREDPFLDGSALEAAKLVALEKQRPPLPADTPASVAEFLQINWNDNPELRWTFEKVSEALRKLQDNVTASEKEFLESTHGHPVYEYEEPNLEAENVVKEEPKAGRRGRQQKEEEHGNKRGSVLSTFFGHKKDKEKRKKVH